MSYSLVRELAVEGHPGTADLRGARPLHPGYYAWVRQPVGQRDLDDANLTNALIDAHDDDPEFGFPFLTDDFDRLGATVGERRVRRL